MDMDLQSEIDKILILQFRTDHTKDHETHCFQEEFHNHPVEFDFFDVINDQLPTELPKNTKGVILAGSGEFYLSDDVPKPWLPQVYQFMDMLLEKDIPLFGICFGYQLMVVHQGAKMVQDLDRREVGTFPVYLSVAAGDDPLFKNLPRNFLALFGHKDSPDSVPESVINYGHSDKVECEMFRIKGKQAWAVLFHPELNRDRMSSRLRLLPDYADHVDETKITEYVEQHFHEAPSNTDILWRFVEYALEEAK